ncbi:hypothetical protein [Nonomuraea sp. NPDC049129]|uniref:hypothetical protein n=1 Tax=Nonomuraea sp. NPDC049129 TaxID=3155272 RepID=UPI0033D42DE3
MREGFFELLINVKAFKCRSLTAQLLSGIDLGYETDAVGAHLVDPQVRIDCARPAGATVVEPFEQDLMGELVNGARGAAGPPGRREPSWLRRADQTR